MAWALSALGEEDAACMGGLIVQPGPSARATAGARANASCSSSLVGLRCVTLPRLHGSLLARLEEAATHASLTPSCAAMHDAVRELPGCATSAVEACVW
jgi:hypothetical protein